MLHAFLFVAAMQCVPIFGVVNVSSSDGASHVASAPLAAHFGAPAGRLWSQPAAGVAVVNKPAVVAQAEVVNTSMPTGQAQKAPVVEAAKLLATPVQPAPTPVVSSVAPVVAATPVAQATSGQPVAPVFPATPAALLNSSVGTPLPQGATLKDPTHIPKMINAPDVKAAHAAKRQVTKQHTVHKAHGPAIFHVLLKDWTEIPELSAFVDKCTKHITKLLPDLRREYTKLNVPKVLLHECDVFSTKEDYMVRNKTHIDDARQSCRYSARRLGAEYLGDQDYKSWCTDLHTYLEEQASRSMQHVEQARLLKDQQKLQDKLDALRQEYSDMQRKKGAIGRELDGLSRRFDGGASLKCCPYDCQICAL